MRIHTIDLRYLDIPQAIAAYVIDAPQGPFLVETGSGSTLDHLIEGLAALGLKLADIRHALVTHIHLDHAGAAGHLAQNGARIYVHEFGVKHMVDPTKLIQSAKRIYREQMDRLWGEIIPVPVDQITAVGDGDVIRINGVAIQAIETPGHARHHHAFALEIDGGRICFTGDIAGITIPGVSPREFLALPTPPPEFDADAWRRSVELLRRERFDAIHPTHFGRSDDPDGHFNRVSRAVDEHVNFMERAMNAGENREAILDRYFTWIREEAKALGLSDRDRTRYLSDNLLTMNVDGMIRWWGKRHPTRLAHS